MKVIARGIPNFAFTTTQEVADLEEFVNTHTLRVTALTSGYRGEYFQPESGSRVSLYVEGVDENIEALLARCIDLTMNSMKTCVIKVDPITGALKSSGTASTIRTGAGDWHMVDPKLDPRYPALLKLARAEAAERARELEAQEERDDEMRGELLDLASGLGYEEAIRRLKGG